MSNIQLQISIKGEMREFPYNITITMFINKTVDGRNNHCGKNIAKFRKEMKISQRMLADKLQIEGLDVDKNAVQRMESGQRFITDIELIYIAKALDKSFDDLFNL